MSPQMIEMHFAETAELSKQLSAVARLLKAAGGEDLAQIISSGRSCWNSECAEILSEKEVRLGGQLIQEAERLGKTAEEMKKQAEKMYQSEMLNARLASVRIY